jgi:hypothetical protein
MQNCTLVHFEQKAEKASDRYKEHISDTKNGETNYAKISSTKDINLMKSKRQW